MSEAVSGVGTKLRKWDGAAWVDIGEVTSISGPTMTKDTIDVTSLDSTGGYREFIGGFKDGGTLSLNMNYVYANYRIMLDDFNMATSAPSIDYEIVIDDSEVAGSKSNFHFKGIVTECPIEIPTDDKITNSVTIKVDGQVYAEQVGETGAAVEPVYPRV